MRTIVKGRQFRESFVILKILPLYNNDLLNRTDLEGSLLFFEVEINISKVTWEGIL